LYNASENAKYEKFIFPQKINKSKAWWFTLIIPALEAKAGGV
jgi:hypothetical protein